MNPQKIFAKFCSRREIGSNGPSNKSCKFYLCEGAGIFFGGSDYVFRELFKVFTLKMKKKEKSPQSKFRGKDPSFKKVDSLPSATGSRLPPGAPVLVRAGVRKHWTNRVLERRRDSLSHTRKDGM